MGYYFSVAGVRLNIRTNNCLLPEYVMQHDVYRHFFSFEKQAVPIDEIRVLLTDEPCAADFSQGDKIFDSNSSLTIYSYKNNRYIVDRFPPYNSPVWIARIDFSQDVVYVFCNPELIDKTDNHLIYNPLSYPLDQILLMNFLAYRKGAVIHGAGWCRDSTGLVFAGVSGAGKTTISNLIHETGNGVFLSDDRIALRDIGGRFSMYGTPWPGEGGFAENRAALLSSVLFLKKGRANRIRPLKPAEAMQHLFPVMSIPWYDRIETLQILDFCASLIEAIPMYELTFRPDKSVVDCIQVLLENKSVDCGFEK